MKKFKISVFVIAFLTIMASCNRGEINRPDITADEAVEIITASVQNATDGLSEQLKDIAQQVTGTIADNFECGVTVDSSFTKSLSKPRVSADYQINWAWTPTCNDLGKMIALDFSSNEIGNFTALRSSGQESKKLKFTITGMQNISTELTFDGSASNEGTQTITVQSTKEVNSVLNMTVDGVIVDKGDNEITSGMVSFTLVVTPGEGDAVTFTGSIEFLGSRDATVIINGETYDIDL